MVGVEGVLVRTHDRTKTERAIHHSVYLAPLRSFRELKPKVGQSTLLLHFGPFRALLKVLPVSELYFRVTDLDLVHPVFLLKAFLAIHVRYGDNAGHMAATSFSDLATPTSYSTSYTLWGLSRTVTAPPGGILTLAHCNGRGT